ncbi:nuclease-related domain-containing DEAD/DEAH box helicase [Comamonas aquatica]|uniref:nuclease-related domain-containing DEAD/DEAH box helicase n=1 Tax=Comamonas aquatica TaxID=225991 RepID=UPI001B36427C|nr:NERD domain-containing protein/DEAD/DEAH box helicase [Comamonas aquatica]QTX21550.1 NERD domain-containing protein [Comamonas aquatica]
MAVIYPDIENIQRLKVSPTPGEWNLIHYLKDQLDDTYEVFFNPYLDGDRPDIIILKEHCSAFIIEVKDWDLKNYKITENNKWEVHDGSKLSRIASPHSQAFRYKKNLYDLHLPIVGLARLTNPNFYNLVHCFVYFHNSEKIAIDSLYFPAEEEHREEQYRINQAIREKKMAFDSYEKVRTYLERKKYNLQRDKNMSFGSDRLGHLAKKIKQSSKHVLFDENVYRDFKRRLSPSNHTLNQGIPIKFDNKQLPLTNSENVKGKIKGVAGCGKTSILSQRAINAHQRHGSTVLILTFNITLKNYIRDKISDIQGNRDFSIFEISNYHQFFNSQVTNSGQDFGELIERHGIDKIYSIDIFQDFDVPKYQTILVDEIQDYQSEWVKIIRDNFLEEDGEMILLGDESQNIYQRDFTRSPVIAQGFGRWIRLTRSYRTSLDSPLNQLFKDFQLKFLIEKHSDIEITDVNPTQVSMGFSLLKYEEITVKDWRKSVFDSIRAYIKSYDLHPNDVVILSSKISLVRQLNELWIENEKTHCMFETYAELATCVNMKIEDLKELNEDEINTKIKQNQENVDRVRRAKKNHFYANSGLVKLSTIHSYKGLESKTVFYVMSEDDDAEIVYTAITRSSENLVILDVGSNNKCSSFLKGKID